MATTLLALRAEDPGAELTSTDITRRNRVATLFVVLVAGASAALVVAPLRPLREWLHRRFESSYGNYLAETDLAANLRLDSVDSTPLSNDPALRLRGPRVDYLRAAAFVDYEGGRWTRMGLHLGCPT